MFFNDIGDIKTLSIYKTVDTDFDNKAFLLVYNNNTYYCRRAIEGSYWYLHSQSLYTTFEQPDDDTICDRITNLKLHEGIGPFSASKDFIIDAEKKLALGSSPNATTIGQGEYIYRITVPKENELFAWSNYMILTLAPQVFNLIWNEDKTTGFTLVKGGINYNFQACRQGLFGCGFYKKFTLNTGITGDPDICSITRTGGKYKVILQPNYQLLFSLASTSVATDNVSIATTDGTAATSADTNTTLPTYMLWAPGGDVVRMRLSYQGEYITDELDINLQTTANEQGTEITYFFTFPDNNYGPEVTAEIY